VSLVICLDLNDKHFVFNFNLTATQLLCFYGGKKEGGRGAIYRENIQREYTERIMYSTGTLSGHYVIIMRADLPDNGGESLGHNNATFVSNCRQLMHVELAQTPSHSRL